MSPADFEFLATCCYKWKLESQSSWPLLQAGRDLYGPTSLELKAFPLAEVRTPIALCLTCGHKAGAELATLTYYCAKCKSLHYFPQHRLPRVKFYEQMLFLGNVLSISRPWIDEITVRILGDVT